MAKHINVLLLTVLSILCTAVWGGSKTPEELECRRKLTGHLDCTAYYAPCAINCFNILKTPFDNVNAFVDAVVNENEDGLFNLFDPAFTMQFYESEDSYEGVCELIDLLTVSWQTGWTMTFEMEPGAQNENVAIAYVNYNINGYYMVNTTVTWIKNACDSWVQTLMDVWEVSIIE